MKYFKFIVLAILLAMPLGVMASSDTSRIYTNDYYLEGENPLEYPYKSDTFKEVVSDELYDEKVDSLNRTFIEVNKYKYQGLLGVDRINIRQTSNNDFNIKNVKVYYRGEKLNYTYLCSNCFGYSIREVKTEFNYDINNEMQKNSLLELVLDKEYNPVDLKVEISYESGNSNNLSGIDIVYYNYASDNKYVLKPSIEPNEYIVFNINNLSSSSTIELKRENIRNYKYADDIILSDEKLNEDFYKLLEVSTKYKYVDRVYLYYKIKSLEVDNTKEDSSVVLKHKNGINRTSNDKIIKEKPKVVSLSKVVNTDLNKNKDTISKRIVPDLKEESINVSSKKVLNESKNNKFQHLFFAIIFIILFLMGYTFYSLKKE